MNEHRWARIGKGLTFVGILTGIILGAFQLIDRFKTPSIYSIAEIRSYYIKPRHQDMIMERLDRNIVLERIRGQQKKGVSPSKIVKDIEDFASAESTDLIASLEFGSVLTPLVIFSVKNDSSVLAKDVKLFLSGGGQAEIAESTEIGVVSSSSKRVDWAGQIVLGDIPPRGNLQVRVWPKDIFLVEFKPALVHANGTGKIMRLQSFYGWDADLVAWFIAKGRSFQIGTIALLLAIVVSVLIFATRRGYITINLGRMNRKPTSEQ